MEHGRVEGVLTRMEHRFAQAVLFGWMAVPYGPIAMGGIEPPQQRKVHGLARYREFAGRVEACLELDIAGERGGFRNRRVQLCGGRARCRCRFFGKSNIVRRRVRRNPKHAKDENHDARR